MTTATEREPAPPLEGLGLVVLAIGGLVSLLLFFLPPLVRIPVATGQSSEPSWVTGVQSVAYTTGPGVYLWIVPLTGLVALAVSLVYGPVFYLLGKKARRTWISWSLGGLLCAAAVVGELLLFWLFAQVISDSSMLWVPTTSPGVQASADAPLLHFTIYFFLWGAGPFLVGVWGQSQLRRAVAYPAPISEADAARLQTQRRTSTFIDRPFPGGGAPY